MTPPIVKRFLIACQQHQLLGVFIFLLCLGVSGIIALQSPPSKPSKTYKVTGQLSYSSPPPLFTSTGEQLQQQGREVGINIIQSPIVLEKVKEQLQLSEQELKQIVEQKLQIEIPEDQQANNQLITIEYNNATTAEEGVEFLGVFMKETIEQSRLLNTSQLRNRIQALQKRLVEVQKELAAAEEAYYRFITTEGAPLLAVQDGSLFNGLTGSQQQQRQLQLMLEEINGKIGSLIDQLGLDPNEAYTAAALSADPILANLRGQILQNEAQIKLLEKDLRPEHPTMINLRKQQQANEQLFRERATEVLGGDGKLKPLPSRLRQDSSLDPARQQLANTLITLQTQREGIQRQLESVKRTEKQLRQQYEEFPERQLQQTRLGQEVETQKALYQTILTALVDAQSAEAETTGSLAIAQAPQYQELLPSMASTNRLLILAAGAGIGLIASGSIIFLLATLDDRLYTARELQDLINEREVPLLGKIPYVNRYDLEGKETSILIDINSVYLTFYERVRTNLRRFGSQSSKVILTTSVNQEEGKSVTAYNLAIASANAGKRTLLLEADLRSPSLANTVKLEPLPTFDNDPLNYYGDRGDAIRLVPGITNLYLVPSPGPLRQVAAILESNELRRLIEDARGRFDVVIIDSPSLSKCNDALLLESFTDGIVLVTRPGISRASMLGETIDQFVETEIPLLGAVINGSESVNLPDSYSDRSLSREADNQLETPVT